MADKNKKQVSLIGRPTVLDYFNYSDIEHKFNIKIKIEESGAGQINVRITRNDLILSENITTICNSRIIKWE